MPKLTVDDLQLYYQIQGQGRPLLLISGVGQGAAFWSALLPLLAERFQVVTFDNRGIGQSDMPDVPYTVEMMAADTLGLMAALSLERPHLVGHSLGAAIAFEIGRSRPELAGRVVMISGLYPGPEVAMPSARAMEVLTNREGDRRELVERGVRIASAPDLEQRRPDLFAALVEAGLNRTQPPHIYLRQSGAGAAYLAAEKLDRAFRPPLCLIYGQADEVAPPANGERIKAKVPQAELHLVPEAGHLAPVEQPQAVAGIVLRFLTEADPAK